MNLKKYINADGRDHDVGQHVANSLFVLGLDVESWRKAKHHHAGAVKKELVEHNQFLVMRHYKRLQFLQ